MAKDAAAPDEGGVKKKGKGKLVGIVVAVVVVAGIGAKFTLPSGGKAGAAVDPTPTPGQVVDLGTITINLADPTPHYAEVGLALEVSPTASADKLTTQMPLLQDAAVSQLSALTEAQVLAPGGQDAIRAALTTRAQQLFGKAIVDKVLLTELVVQ
jgi:flagellar basal body-associated protein FliL